MGGPGLVDGKVCHSVDNFGYSKFVVDGIEYYSAENYFQCQKCVEDGTGKKTHEFEQVRNSGYGADCWSAGTRVTLRRDWEIVKVRKMYEGNKAKFEQNPEIAKDLLSTKGPITFDNSTAFWCTWNARIMELLREELRQPEERNVAKIKLIWGQIEQYETEQRKQLKV